MLFKQRDRPSVVSLRSFCVFFREEMKEVINLGASRLESNSKKLII